MYCTLWAMILYREVSRAESSEVQFSVAFLDLCSSRKSWGGGGGGKGRLPAEKCDRKVDVVPLRHRNLAIDRDHNLRTFACARAHNRHRNGRSRRFGRDWYPGGRASTGVEPRVVSPKKKCWDVWGSCRSPKVGQFWQDFPASQETVSRDLFR